MIVKKPIGAVKAGGTLSRLTVGKKVPQIVLDFWEESGQLEELKKGGFICEGKKSEKPKEIEKEKELKIENNDSIFKNEKR